MFAQGRTFYKNNMKQKWNGKRFINRWVLLPELRENVFYFYEKKAPIFSVEYNSFRAVYVNKSHVISQPEK